MKIINRTIWRTDHLKAILQKAAEIELEPAKRKVLVVTVSYTRGHYSSGCAYLGGRHATVRIQHPESRSRRIAAQPSPEQKQELVIHFASVAAHEFAHIRGADHQTMSAKYKWTGSWREYVAWAADMSLEPKPAKAIIKPSIDAKLDHVLAMKAKAVTRVKRATTLLNKWKAKERYYLKAAQKAKQS